MNFRVVIALILKLPGHFGKKLKISRGFLQIKKKKIQELSKHISNLLIHDNKMEQKYFFMFKTLKNNTSQFISLAKDVGIIKGPEMKQRFYPENMKNHLQCSNA